MTERFGGHDCTPAEENKTGTIVAALEHAVTAEAAPRVPARRCGYVVAYGVAPFCDRPALAGSSYCAWHRALCAVASASPAFAALAADQARATDRVPLPPAEFGWLRALAPPEPFDESDDERLAGLELPAAAISRDE